MPSENNLPETETETRSVKDAAIAEFKEITSVVVVAAILVLILRTFLFQPFTIPSASMEPNLYQGDYIIVSKWDYGYSKHSALFSPPLFDGRIFESQPKRGDIVVFKLPSDNKTDYIKRIIGLPGDRIQMKEGRLYINETVVPAQHLGPVGNNYSYDSQIALLWSEALPDGRAHTMQDIVSDGPVDNTDVYTVPAGHYFAMGDNRDNSLDSRYPPINGQGVGFVPAENLEGRARFVLMSWKEGAALWKPWTWLNFRFFKGLEESLPMVSS
jgi:signal peptidase I